MQYKNVTISGLPGAGSSTLGRGIAEKLGWEYFSGGDFLRKYAIDHGLFDPNNKTHHDQSIFDDEVDRNIESYMRQTVSEKEGYVLDSWLSGFNAQGVPGTLKVLVVCSENAVRIDRIVNRDAITVEEAKKHIFDREAKNVAKWSRMYAQEWKERVVEKGKSSADKPVYFWYPQLYDLVLDTFSLSKEQTLQQVLEKIGYH